MQRLRLKPRRGAIAVMTALVFFALVVCMGVAVDFSRLWTIRNELQTGADAAALAGAMQLQPPRDSLRVVDSATAYARVNRTLTDTMRVDSVEKGNYNGATRVFTAGGAPTNAVNVVTSYLPSRMWMRSVGATIPRMKARAVAWTSAPVAATPSCMKPWAVPYEEMMYRINLYRGITPANSTPNMTRAFDQVNDIAALQNMTAAQRTFSLKIGSNTPSGAYNPTSGAYQAVQLGKYWDYATQSIANPGPQNGGANAYEGHISGTTCHGLAVGDSLQSEQGNMVGPTINGMCKNGNIAAFQACNTPAVCTHLVGSGTNIGDCYNANGTVGVDVKAAFFSCGNSCNGSSKYGVKLLGSFTVKKAYPSGPGGPNPAYSKAEIVGEFKPIQASGGAGGGSTTLLKLVLVK